MCGTQTSSERVNSIVHVKWYQQGASCGTYLPAQGWARSVLALKSLKQSTLTTTTLTGRLDSTLKRSTGGRRILCSARTGPANQHSTRPVQNSRSICTIRIGQSTLRQDARTAIKFASQSKWTRTTRFATTQTTVVRHVRTREAEY